MTSGVFAGRASEQDDRRRVKKLAENGEAGLIGDLLTSSLTIFRALIARLAK
jgi:hypothetical protein